MVRLYFSVLFHEKMKNKEYPEKVGLGEYDGDVGVDGELSGCKFHGVLAGRGTTSRWHFDEIWFYVECEKIDDVVNTAKAIEKFLTDKGLEFEIPYYELELRIPVMLPIRIEVGDSFYKYEIAGSKISIKCEKLEDIIAIKK